MQQPGRAAEIKALGIGKSFGSFRALNDLTLDIGRGEFLTLLGPSGSGKTTFLMILAGFVQPSDGKLFSDGVDITARPSSAPPAWCSKATRFSRICRSRRTSPSR